jgi:hypothetical protein
MANRIALLILIVFVLGGAFYWFVWRPSETRKVCAATAERSRNIILDFDSYDDVYSQCMKSRGMER